MKNSAVVLWIGIIANAFAMIFFTFYLMKLPWLASDEKLLIWSSSALKFATREVPPSEDFALINTSYDLQLIDRLDDFGFPVGQQVVTDREKLAVLLEVIAKAKIPPKYILLDIHFVDSTASDKRLGKALSQFDNLILSYHLNADNHPEYPIFKNINRGLSDYVIGSIFDGVYKYQLIYNDTLHLTPLKIHEFLSGDQVTNYGNIVKVGDRWTPNNFIMNYRLLQKDIVNPEAGFNPVSLGELLFLADEDIQDFVAGKVIVIGDFFEHDLHETLFEITAGPLILLNAFLTIQAGDTYVNFWFFLLLFLVYVQLSYMVFVEGDILEDVIARKFGAVKTASFLAGLMSYVVILALLSLTTFFIFNIHLNIFFLGITFYIMDKIMAWVYQRVRKQV